MDISTKEELLQVLKSYEERLVKTENSLSKMEAESLPEKENMEAQTPDREEGEGLEEAPDPVEPVDEIEKILSL